MTQRDRFLLLGCDGFFGVFNPEDAAALTAKLLEGRSAKSVCEKLINEVRPPAQQPKRFCCMQPQ